MQKIEASIGHQSRAAQLRSATIMTTGRATRQRENKNFSGQAICGSTARLTSRA
jgi:hypothetical protein